MHDLFESPIADILINAGTAHVYITGLIGFVAWLERSKVKRRTSTTETR